LGLRRLRRLRRFRWLRRLSAFDFQQRGWGDDTHHA